MLHAFEQHLETHFGFLKSSRLLLAISGGLDSVVLANLGYKLKLDMAWAHCNFNLRANESDGDEAFVSGLAKKHGIELHIAHFDTHSYAQKEGCSIQMAARKLRYDWFDELANRWHYDYILTAHHADDNLETVLINLIRGTGLDGLTGIPETSHKIVRPLLPFSREALETYAVAQGLTWREDSSNASTKYLRNKLRHEVIPIFKTINPQLLQSFQTTLANLQESQLLISDYTADFRKEIVQEVDGQIKLKVAAIKKYSNPQAYLYALLRDYNFTAWSDIVHLLEAQSGKQVFSPTHKLLRDREFLILERIAAIPEGPIFIPKAVDAVAMPMGILNFTSVPAISNTSKMIVYVDASKLQFPLTLRKWQEGDVFYPLGMKGKKKLSKYFKDEKLSLIDKQKNWLLLSGAEVVWVVGRRADERFKITQNTTHILKIELHHK